MKNWYSLKIFIAVDAVEDADLDGMIFSWIFSKIRKKIREKVTKIRILLYKSYY